MESAYFLYENVKTSFNELIQVDKIFENKEIKPEFHREQCCACQRIITKQSQT